MMPRYLLVSFKTCPWVQRAAIVLREKAIDFEFRHIEPDNRPDWFLAISPHKKVPVLRIDDTVSLFESNAIAEYLDETIPPRLHPDDPVERAINRAWTAEIHATLNHGGIVTSRNHDDRHIWILSAQTVLAGGVWTPADVDPTASADAETAAVLARLATLTPQQVRAHVFHRQGLGNEPRGEATVKAHVSAILQKLGVESRTQAVIAAAKIEIGQITEDRRQTTGDRR
jgi:glutathione S-transferase